MLAGRAMIALVVALAAATVVLPSLARATTPWMTDAEIKSVFGGRTIEGAYGDGRTFVETYFDTGRLDYKEEGRPMTGRWLVVENTFCTLYDGIPTGGCFKVARTSENCFEFYFTARDELELAEDVQDRMSWTARGWRKDLPTTCPSKATS